MAESHCPICSGPLEIREVAPCYDCGQRAAHIRSRFGGRVFLIDTGMLSTFWQGGRASALEIRAGGKFTAQYQDGQEVLREEKSPESAAKAN